MLFLPSTKDDPGNLPSPGHSDPLSVEQQQTLGSTHVPQTMYVVQQQPPHAMDRTGAIMTAGQIRIPLSSGESRVMNIHSNSPLLNSTLATSLGQPGSTQSPAPALKGGTGTTLFHHVEPASVEPSPPTSHSQMSAALAAIEEASLLASASPSYPLRPVESTAPPPHTLSELPSGGSGARFFGSSPTVRAPFPSSGSNPVTTQSRLVSMIPPTGFGTTTNGSVTSHHGLMSTTTSSVPSVPTFLSSTSANMSSLFPGKGTVLGSSGGAIPVSTGPVVIGSAGKVCAASAVQTAAVQTAAVQTAAAQHAHVSQSELPLAKPVSFPSESALHSGSPMFSVGRIPGRIAPQPVMAAPPVRPPSALGSSFTGGTLFGQQSTLPTFKPLTTSHGDSPAAGVSPFAGKLPSGPFNGSSLLGVVSSAGHAGFLSTVQPGSSLQSSLKSGGISGQLGSGVTSGSKLPFAVSKPVSVPSVPQPPPSSMPSKALPVTLSGSVVQSSTELVGSSGVGGMGSSPLAQVEARALPPSSQSSKALTSLGVTDKTKTASGGTAVQAAVKSDVTTTTTTAATSDVAIARPSLAIVSTAPSGVGVVGLANPSSGSMASTGKNMDGASSGASAVAVGNGLLRASPPPPSLSPPPSSVSSASAQDPKEGEAATALLSLATAVSLTVP